MKKKHILTCIILSLVWFVGVPSALGAKVAGEKDITPTVNADQKQKASAQESAPAKKKPDAYKKVIVEKKTPPKKVPVRRVIPQRPSVQSGGKPVPRKTITPAKKEPVTVKPAAKPLPGVQSVQATKSPAEQKLAAPAKKAPSDKDAEKRYVTIDFDNVDIAIFIKFISELTGKNFVIDKGVRGKVTIISPTKISVDEAYKVFESVLEVHGFTTVPAGSIIKIVPSVTARSKKIETLLKEHALEPEDKVVTQLIPLKYADPNELKKLLTPLISKTSIIISYPPTGMLIMTDVLSNIQRLLRIIKVIDVEGIGEQVSVLPLEYAAANVLAKTLTTVFQQKAQKTRKVATTVPTVRIVPDERTNVLIILASEADTVKIKKLIEILDKETPRAEGDIHVIYLQNANAEELAKVLMAIPKEESKTAKKGKAPVISKEVQIVADTATNSLVITAKKEDFLTLQEVIEKLDILRRMVYIEALLMEVGVNKQFDLGVEWKAAEEVGSHEGRKIVGFGANTARDSAFPSLNVATGAVALAEGFSLGVLGESISISGVQFPNIGAVIHAFQSDSDVHILSTPQIMTTDNEEAEINVTKNIPFLTRQDTSQTGIDYSNYEYKDVGVMLNITPQINQERFVRLKLSQEVSQVVEQEQVGLPTTLKRVAKTTVIIKDGHTVVIGGLIDETLNQTRTQVPCLGNTAALGWLFRSESKSGDRTNLYIFLTPHIIENPTEAERVYEDKKKQIDRIKEGVIKMYDKPKFMLEESTIEKQ